MIESARCTGMNNCSRVDFNTQESLQNTSDFSSSLINVCSLPADLKREIAFYLDSESYVNLRVACKAMSEDLESVSMMKARLAQGLSGDLARDYRKIVRDHIIRGVLKGDRKKELALALRNCFVRPDRVHRDRIEVGAKYLPDVYPGAHPTRVGKAIKLCAKGIKTFIPPTSSRSFNPDILPAELWENSIGFRSSDLNERSLEEIFSSFNETYHHVQGAEKYVVAYMAYKLRNYWVETPPSPMMKEGVISCCAAYPELFRAGDNVEELMEVGFVLPEPGTSSPLG